jgi:hypothetical protein
MAQTKTKRAKPAKKSRASSTTSKTKSRAKASTTKTKSRAKSRAKSASAKAKSTQRNGASNGVTGEVASGVGDGAKAVRHAVGSAGHAVGSAGKEAGHAVSKARIPLLAGGAAVAGTVGGLVLGASRSGDKVLGIKLPRSKRVKLRSRDFSKAAKEVGRFGENVGELTTELRRAREGLANGEGKQSSPIEVLLSSLTARHH